MSEQFPSKRRCLNPDYCLRGIDGECFPCDHGSRTEECEYCHNTRQTNGKLYHSVGCPMSTTT